MGSVVISIQLQHHQTVASSQTSESFLIPETQLPLRQLGDKNDRVARLQLSSVQEPLHMPARASAGIFIQGL